MEIFIVILQALLYGVVEGITEWLPISSTGHLIILDDIFNVKATYPEFWDFFLVVIQLGAILAVILRFFKELNPINPKLDKTQRNDIWKVWLKIIIGVIPVCFIALILQFTRLDAYLDNTIIISTALIVYGVIFIALETYLKKDQKKFFTCKDLGLVGKNEAYFKYESTKDMPYMIVFLIGLSQILSLIPGTSRSGVTIVTALLLGCSRTCGAEFSFYLSIPVMIGASLVKFISFMGEGVAWDLNMTLYLVFGLLAAFITSLVIINTLMKFIKKHTFIGFGYYRIVLGVVLIILVLAGVMN